MHRHQLVDGYPQGRAQCRYGGASSRAGGGGQGGGPEGRVDQELRRGFTTISTRVTRKWKLAYIIEDVATGRAHVARQEGRDAVRKDYVVDATKGTLLAALPRTPDRNPGVGA